MTLQKIADELCRTVDRLAFSPPVDVVYNPLNYAREPYRRYVERFGKGRKEVVLVGMNPGPWGMAQTGVPFGEVAAVREWMGIHEPVGKPDVLHPKRPVEGFECRRSEVSGRRLWGWVRERFGPPHAFFERFFVLNYCPLLFIEESGRNRTPDKLKTAERAPLFAACNRAVRRSLEILEPVCVVGVGAFASDRVQEAAAGLPVTCGRITHPSPANPRANRGWATIVERELQNLGIELPEG